MDVIELLLFAALSFPGTAPEEQEAAGSDSGADASSSVEEAAEVEVPVQLRVRVLRGNLTYVLPEGGDVQRLRPNSPPLETETGVYLEFGVSTKVELVWNGVGSARIEGPATISWRAGQPALSILDEASSRDSKPKKPLTILQRFEAHKQRLITNRPEIRQPIHLVLGAFRAVELEAHGAGFLIEADREGWKLEASSGAMRLESRKNNVLRVAHHGGKPVRVRTNRLRPPGTWPVRIPSGARVDLPAPLEESTAVEPSSAKKLGS